MWLKLLIAYCTLLLFASICGFVNYKKMDPPSRVLVWYISATCLSEVMATGAIYFYKYNLIVYHVYSLLQLFLISLYFNTACKSLRKNNLGIIIGIIGVVLGVLNSIYFQQPTHSINTNFFVIEAFLIIGLSLFSFYELLASDETHVNRNPLFWFSSLFLVFWSFTFFYWLIGVTIRKAIPEDVTWMDTMIWIINILTYTGFAIVFLSYRKMQKD